MQDDNGNKKKGNKGKDVDGSFGNTKGKEGKCLEGFVDTKGNMNVVKGLVDAKGIEGMDLKGFVDATGYKGKNKG